jgi:hypothetical protein
LIPGTVRVKKSDFSVSIIAVLKSDSEIGVPSAARHFYVIPLIINVGLSLLAVSEIGQYQERSQDINVQRIFHFDKPWKFAYNIINLPNSQHISKQHYY